MTPDAVADRVEDIGLPTLRAWGIRGVALDLDNTIVPWHTALVTPAATEWVTRVRAAGIRVCVLTNNYSAQARSVAQRLDLPIVTAAFKPLPRGFRRALRLLEVAPAAGLAVGDQLFTDVLGAKLVGMRAVVVRPLSTREFPTTKLLRLLEIPLYHRLGRDNVARP